MGSRAPYDKRSLWRGLLLPAAIALIIVFYFLIDPALYSWVPKCPTKMLTGFDCPGCGSQRMLHALLHGDFTGAGKANAFMLASIPYILLLALVEMFPGRYPSMRCKLMGAKGISLMLVAVVLWTVARNIFGW